MTERAKVLLVDDRPENLLALEAILAPMDLDLVRANSGEEALRALLQAEFALILLDAQMPGMDGFDTAARIKRRNIRIEINARRAGEPSGAAIGCIWSRRGRALCLHIGQSRGRLDRAGAADGSPGARTRGGPRR